MLHAIAHRPPPSSPSNDGAKACAPARAIQPSYRLAAVLRWCAWVLGLLALSWAVQAQPTTTAVTSAAAPTAAATPAIAAYRVGAGDELNFRFVHTPELNTTAVVRSDGAVTLPLLGELTVVGRTLAELAADIEAALAQRVRRPQVVINVQGSIPSQRVFVGGEVGRPGVQNLAGPLTALQAVLAADGLRDTAQPANVTVLRQGPNGERQVLKLDLQAVMDGREGAQDLALAPYDVVLVPRSGIANVGLWVDQWVRRVVPLSLGFSYTINRNGTLQ
jgi:protein involved in polysaccharide export with SLBB domain